MGLLLILGLPSGCQNDQPSQPDASTQSRIDRVEANGVVLAKEQGIVTGPTDSTEVRVRVVQGPDPGNPVAGVTVHFSEFLGEDNGSFSKTEVLTDALGQASAVYRPQGIQSGTITLKVTAEESVRYVLVEIRSSGGTPPVGGAGIQLTSSSGATSLPADGQSTLQINGTVTSGEQALPVAGTTVTLVAGDQFIDADGDGLFSDGDQLVPTGDRNGNGEWGPEGSVPATLRTDANGQFTFLYRAGSEQGTVYVRATTAEATADFSVLQHPTSLQVRLSTGEREVLADGVSRTMVQAQVLEWGGSPIKGVIVKFVAGEIFTDVDGDGYFTPGVDSYEDANLNGRWDAIGSIQSVGTTQNGGQVTVPYTAGYTAGPVAIRATTTNGFATAIVQLIALPPTSTLGLTLDRTFLPADGVSQISGTVVATDISGADQFGKLVSLVASERFEDADGDGQFTPGTDTLLEDLDGDGAWTAMGEIDAEVHTDASAVGHFTYRAGHTPGEVWICAAADGISTETKLVLQDLPTAWTLELTSSVTKLVVTGTGGIDNAVLAARAFDSQGDPVPARVLVTFNVVSGPGDGERIQGEVSGTYSTVTDADGEATAVLSSGSTPGLITVRASSGTTVRTLAIPVDAGPAASIECEPQDPVVAYTDPSGVAEATLASGTVSGTVVLRVEAGDGVSEFTSVAIAAGPPVHIAAAKEQCNVLGYGFVNVENPVVALVSDVYNNPVRAGTVVYWTTDNGVVHGDQGLGSSTTTNGVANGVWRSGNSCGYVTVTASTLGETVVSSTTFISSEYPYSSEIVSPTAHEVSLTADGDSEITLWVEVLDFDGMYVLPTDLDVTTLYGTIPNQDPSGDGCRSSVARIKYRSATLDRDHSVTTPDDGIGANDVITVSTGYGGLADQLVVHLQTSGAFGQESSVSVGGAVQVGGQVLFQVMIADRYGNPLGGHTLSASVTVGSVSDLAPTDQWGTSTGTFTAPGATGTVTLTVLDTDPNYGGLLLTQPITVQ